MNPSSLELLEKSDLPAAQARAILHAVDLEITSRESALATKADLQAMKQELVGMLHGSESKIHGLELRIEGVRTEMQKLGTKLVLWSFLFWVTGIGTLFSLFKWLK